MKNAIILHGKPDPGQEEYYNPTFPSSSNAHWLPWLQKQLIINNIAAQTPEIPNAWKPDYATWQKEFERYDITPQTILIGHSCGAGFFVRWLSEHPDIHVDTVALVAPSLGIDWDNTGFFDFEIDPRFAERVERLIIFVSDDDRAAIQQSVHKIRDAIPTAGYREFHGYGHFCFSDMNTVEFPELRDEILAAS
jgi:predicted alpha/beta hydrolase family esterase